MSIAAAAPQESGFSPRWSKERSPALRRAPDSLAWSHSLAADGAKTPREPGELIVRIAEHRDEEAFKALYEAFAPRVKSYLLAQGASLPVAEDLAQESLLSVWRKASYYDPGRASAGAWIFTIARNLRIDRIRHERASLFYDLDPPEQADESPRADEQMEGAETQAAVRRAMTSLPLEQVEVIRMSFFLDKPHSQIAEELKLPLGTVKSRVRLAMARLRSVLEKRS